MGTTGYERDWLVDLRVLQDHAPETLAVQGADIRVEERRRLSREVLLAVLVALLIVGDVVAYVVTR